MLIIFSNSMVGILWKLPIKQSRVISNFSVIPYFWSWGLFCRKMSLALATAEFFVHYPNQNVTKTDLEKSTDSLPCIDRHAERTLRRTLVQSNALEMWQLLLCQMVLCCGLVIKLQAMLKSDLMGWYIYTQNYFTLAWPGLHGCYV